MSRARPAYSNGPSRDRSPPRQTDRFASAQASGPSVHPSRQAVFTQNREGPPPPPPPRTFDDAARASGLPPYASRGRGFSSRGDYRADYRDRDPPVRDRRESPPRSAIESDRSWRASDQPRARSPPRGRDFRDFRDTEWRDGDFNRPRRSSPDRPPPASTFSASGPPAAPRGFGRGSGRGRGRGDWDGARGRGRGYPDERDLFSQRSRSPRDRRRDADERPAARRDDVWPRPTRDERARDAERFRDGPLAPDETPARRSSLPSAPSSMPTSLKRTSTTNAPEASRQPGSNVWRNEASRTSGQSSRPASPPRAPEVPAFGSVSIQNTPLSEGWGVKKPPTEAPKAPAQMLKTSPILPRSDQQAKLPPHGPRAERMLSNSSIKDVHMATNAASQSARQISPVPGAPKGPSSQLQASPVLAKSPPSGPRNAVLPARRPSMRQDGMVAPLSHSARSPPVSPAYPVAPSGPRSSVSNGSLPAGSIPTGPRNMGARTSMSWQNGRPQSLQTSPQPTPVIPAKRSTNGELRDGYFAEAPAKFPRSSTSPDAQRARNLDVASKQETVADESKDDAVDEDDLMDLDETDFDGNEARFEKKKALLEAKKHDLLSRHLRGASPLEELGLIGALVQQDLQQLLALRNKDSVEKPAAIKPLSESRNGMQTPKTEDRAESGLPVVTPMAASADKFRSPSLAYDSPPSQSPPPVRTPELLSLPFLNREPLTPLSELETFQDNISRHDTFKQFARLRMLDDLDSQMISEEDLLQEYALLYRAWKINIKELDERAAQEKEEKERQLSAERALAPEVPDPVPAIPAPIEGSRRARAFHSEYAFQKAMEESKRSQEEEEATRKKDALEALGPDRSREAEIPDMLSDAEARLRLFKDTSCLRDPDEAVFFFQLRPPPDTFTEDEHRTMVENFREYPKKWGKLTQGLEGRDYKDCINHYYATKWNKEFKQRPVKGKGKRGVRSARAGGKGKTNALISNLGGAEPDLYGGDEANAPLVSVTERGRPRRAAAPSFGDSKADDQSQTPGKKAARPVVSSEASSEKVSRKTKVGARGNAQRRGRAPPATAKRSASPQKTDITPEAVTPAAAATAAAAAAGGTAGAPDSRGSGVVYADASARDEYFARAMHSMSHTETTRSLLPHSRLNDLSQGTVQDLHFAQPSNVPGALESGRAPSQPTAKGAPSSYWAGHEKTSFPELVKRFGTDWHAISLHIGGGKSATMCKNYYGRLVSGGKTDLGELAAAADAKRNATASTVASTSATASSAATAPSTGAFVESGTTFADLPAASAAAPQRHHLDAAPHTSGPPRSLAPNPDSVIEIHDDKPSIVPPPPPRPTSELQGRYAAWDASPRAGTRGLPPDVLPARGGGHSRQMSGGHRSETGPVDWVQGTKVAVQPSHAMNWASQGRPASIEDAGRHQRVPPPTGIKHADGSFEEPMRLTDEERIRISSESRTRFLNVPSRKNPEYYSHASHMPGAAAAAPPSEPPTHVRQPTQRQQYGPPLERSPWADRGPARETPLHPARETYPPPSAERGPVTQPGLSAFHRDTVQRGYPPATSTYSPSQTPMMAQARPHVESRYEVATPGPEPSARDGPMGGHFGVERVPPPRSVSSLGQYDHLRQIGGRGGDEEMRSAAQQQQMASHGSAPVSARAPPPPPPPPLQQQPQQQQQPAGPAAPPAPRTEPKKSSIFSMLNPTEPEDLKPSRSLPAVGTSVSRTRTPPQYAPQRPPSVTERRDMYGDMSRPASGSYQPPPLGHGSHSSPHQMSRELPREPERRQDWHSVQMHSQYPSSTTPSSYSRGPEPAGLLGRTSTAPPTQNMQAHGMHPSPPPAQQQQQQYGFNSTSATSTPGPGHSRDSSYSRPPTAAYGPAQSQYGPPERGSQYAERPQYGAPHSASETPQPSYASSYAPPPPAPGASSVPPPPHRYGTPSNHQAHMYGSSGGYQQQQQQQQQQSQYAGPAPPARYGEHSASYEQQERERQREAQMARSSYGQNRYGEPPRR